MIKTTNNNFKDSGLEKRRARRRATCRQKHYLRAKLMAYMLGLAIAVGAMCGMYMQRTAEATPVAEATDEAGVSYVRILVPKGATLWSIASDINDGSHDTRTIIYTICSRNGIDDAAVISAGELIEVPVYSKAL